ncbi:FecR domain-containing protein [Chitinophaga pollutisoli]|uniref:FecR domain-containing protein n=1 Tax=Chitinophaga pollutisoli TaxID=3133966 RepID=A0ABZ2YVU2_9BACT
MLSNEYMDTLIARDIEGTISGAEQRELADWLQEDPANQAYYEALKDTWDLAADAWTEVPEPDTAANWERFSQKIAVPEPAPLQVAHRGRGRWLAAAGVAAILATGIAFFLTQSDKTITLAATAEKQLFTLPDGSKVYLNRNSTLQYDERFAENNRNITLEGEAFFDVAPNAAHPFIVHAGASQTEVLGTSFGIKAYGEQPVRLNVVTGKVAFSNATRKSDALVLTAGHAAEVRAGKDPQAVTDTDPNFTSWKDNKLVFNHASLAATFSAMEEYFGITIHIEDSAIAGMEYMGTFSDPNLDSMMKVIAASTEVKIVEESKGVYKVSK